MARSKKFKPLLSMKDFQPGKTFIKVVVTEKGVVDIKVFKISGKPRLSSWPSGIGNSSSWRYDELCFCENGPPYLFTDRHVADAIRISNGYRYEKSYYYMGTRFSLNDSALFEFSNKLWQKLKELRTDPVAVLKFLNPGVMITPGQVIVIQFSFYEKQYEVNKEEKITKLYKKDYDVNDVEKIFSNIFKEPLDKVMQKTTYKNFIKLP